MSMDQDYAQSYLDRGSDRLGLHRYPVPADAPTLVVSADQRTLEGVLRLRLGPNEPYLFGELTVRGPEADFVRLDYIASVLCPL